MGWWFSTFFVANWITSNSFLFPWSSLISLSRERLHTLRIKKTKPSELFMQKPNRTSVGNNLNLLVYTRSIQMYQSMEINVKFYIHNKMYQNVGHCIYNFKWYWIGFQEKANGFSSSQHINWMFVFLVSILSLGDVCHRTRSPWVYTFDW